MSPNVGLPRALTPLSVRKAVRTPPLLAPLPFVTKSSSFSHQIILGARLGSLPQQRYGRGCYMKPISVPGLLLATSVFAGGAAAPAFAQTAASPYQLSVFATAPKGLSAP